MEVWKNIEGFENYQVSDLGSVRNVRKNKLLKGCKDKDGYLISTFRNNNVKKVLKFHRLVALHFIPNPENKPQVNHKKGIKIDNRATELEWCTNSENQIHAYVIGLKTGRKGEKCNFYNLKGKLNFNTKKVVNIKTNQVYDCAKDVSDFLEYSHVSFIKQLNGNNINKTDFRYLPSD